MMFVEFSQSPMLQGLRYGDKEDGLADEKEK